MIGHFGLPRRTKIIANLLLTLILTPPARQQKKKLTPEGSKSSGEKKKENTFTNFFFPTAKLTAARRTRTFESRTLGTVIRIIRTGLAIIQKPANNYYPLLLHTINEQSDQNDEHSTQKTIYFSLPVFFQAPNHRVFCSLLIASRMYR